MSRATLSSPECPRSCGRDSSVVQRAESARTVVKPNPVSRALARPIAMFVDESDDESIAASIDAGVSAYVVDGLAAHRIRSLLDVTVRRFNAFARLQAELDEARGALAERDAIDRAKRILMDSRKLTEPAAYAELRRTAMNQGKRIADIAAAVVTAHQLLGGME